MGSAVELKQVSQPPALEGRANQGLPLGRAQALERSPVGLDRGGGQVAKLIGPTEGGAGARGGRGGVGGCGRSARRGPAGAPDPGGSTYPARPRGPVQVNRQRARRAA